jgi:copper chaperone
MASLGRAKAAKVKGGRGQNLAIGTPRPLQGTSVARHIDSSIKEIVMTLLSVPDMSCGHCKASVEAALTPLTGMAPVTVDLAQRQVSVAGPAAEAVKALAAIGFPAMAVA